MEDRDEHNAIRALAPTPLRLRSAIVPVLNVTSSMAMPAIMVGFFLATMTRSPIGSSIALVGIALFALTVVFQLVTLPVEFDASARALAALERGNLVLAGEHRGAKTVLSAAALTYVAAAVASLSQLLYFVLRYAALRGRDDES